MRQGKFWAIFFGLAALLLVGWYGYRAFGQQSGFPLAKPFTEIAEVVSGDNLPTEPDDWQGKIDYLGIDSRIAVLAARPEMAGLAVAIVEDGEISFVRTYGVADKRSGEPVTPQTVFRWASVSKGVAGTLAAKLSNEGVLNLDAPLSQWQTSLRLPRGANAQVSLAQLLSHQTGLTKNAYDRKLEAGERPGLLRAGLGAAPMKCDPGKCHSYQNIAFDASSEILGAVTGTLYTDAVQEQLFVPLGMESARFGMRGLTSAENWARPHRGEDVRTLVESYWLLPAAAGVNSDIVDMARWMQAQMGENPDVLPVETLALAQIPLVRTGRVYGKELARALEQPGYGLGWRSFTYRGRHLVGHGGAVNGYRATMIFDPAARTGVVAMWNADWGRPFNIPFAVLDSYYGAPADPASVKDWLDISDLPPPEPAQPLAPDEAVRR